jgi:hypothetical protein
VQNDLPEDTNEDLTEEQLAQIDSASLEELLGDLDAVEQTIVQVEDGELPEELIAPALESLMGIVNDLQEAGSISRADAQSIMSMSASMEGFDTTFNNMPLASFTELPSKVNYKPAMEGIVGNIVKAVIEAIKRIIQFVREKAKELKGLLRGNSVVAAQAKAAATLVIKDHRPVTQAALIEAIRRQTEKPVDKPAPLVTKAVTEANSASDVEAAEKVINVAREELSLAIPDLYIRFFEDDILGKMSSNCDALLVACGDALKSQDAVRFFNRIEDIVSEMNDRKLSINLDAVPLGESRGSARMNQNASVIRTALSDTQRLFLKSGRTFDLVTKRDGFECLNKMADGLSKYRKAVIDPAPKTTSLLRHIEDQLNKFERLVSSKLDESELQKAQERATFLQIMNSVVMFSHRVQCDINLHVGRIAKLIHQYRVQ